MRSLGLRENYRVHTSCLSTWIHHFLSPHVVRDLLVYPHSRVPCGATRYIGMCSGGFIPKRTLEKQKVYAHVRGSIAIKCLNDPKLPRWHIMDLRWGRVSVIYLLYNKNELWIKGLQMFVQVFVLALSEETNCLTYYNCSKVNDYFSLAEVIIRNANFD